MLRAVVTVLVIEYGPLYGQNHWLFTYAAPD